MNFDLKNTAIFGAIRRERFLPLKLSVFFKNLFLFLFLFSVLFALFSLGYSAVKMAVLFMLLYFIFWEISLFTALKVKSPIISGSISQALLDVENCNLAEFLTFDAAKIILDSIDFCQRKKISVGSISLFYSIIKSGKKVRPICFRLGLDPQKLQEDIKNYLEKTPKETNVQTLFAKDFQNTMKEAAKAAVGFKNERIGEKEIFIALAKHDEFFKKILVDHELKKQDIENLVMWLGSLESSVERQKKFWSYENLLRQGSLGKDWTSGYTINLDQFSIDWRKIVSKWPHKEIMCHKQEIEKVETILARSNLSNALIVGEPGSARKSIVEALAQKCYLGTTLPELNNKRVVELDLGSLLASISSFDELENILEKIFGEVLQSGNVILFINNLHNFVGHDSPNTKQKPGLADISGILSRYLAIPTFQFVAITDFSGLHKNIEQVPSFSNFFQKVEVSEVTQSETIQILQNLAIDLEQKYKIAVLYPSVREIVNLASRYLPSLPFPEKAINILNELMVYVRGKKEQVVLPHHVAEVVSNKTGIPVGKIEAKEKEVLLNLENLIHNRIINQQEAVKGISTAMRRARVGIASKTRPMGTFLFLGPTGVGKTETAKALAQIYFGQSEGLSEKMIRLDMSEFQAVSDIPRLIGSVSPVEMQGLLTTPVREAPFSLVLMDEIEKAHPNILNLLLQILDEGFITDGQGRKVVFSSTIIICTSNAGAEIIFKQAELGKTVDKDSLFKNLFEKNIFRPEFVNRFDAAVIFNPLSQEHLMQIAQLFLQRLQKELKEKEIDFIITEDLKEKIVKLSYKPEFGAREMRRVIQDKVENAVAAALLGDKIKKGDRFEINPENFELVINQPKE